MGDLPCQHFCLYDAEQSWCRYLHLCGSSVWPEKQTNSSLFSGTPAVVKSLLLPDKRLTVLTVGFTRLMMGVYLGSRNRERLSNVGEGECFVSIREVCINMIKSIVSSCRERNVSIEFGESCSREFMLDWHD